MKKLIILVFTLISAISVFGQPSNSGTIRYYGARSTAQEPATCSTAIGGIYYNTTEKSFYQCTDTNTWTEIGAGGGGGGMAIGDAVTDGTECRILYIDASGNLAQDTGLCYDASTKTLKLPQGNSSGVLFGTVAGTFGGRILRSNTGSILIGIADGTEFSVLSQGGSALLSLDSSGNGSVAGNWTVADDAYDATGWNGSLEVPTKNAVRDKIETLGGGASSPLTLTASSASEIPLTLTGAASQTANLTEWTNNTPTVVASVNPSGDFTMRNLFLLDTTARIRQNGGIELTSNGNNLTFNTSGQLRGATDGTFQIQWGSAGGGIRRVSDGVLAITVGFDGSTYNNSSGSLLMRQAVTLKTTNYPVTAEESNSLFTNEGATASVDFALPTAAVGLQYQFCVQDADGVTVTANTGDTIRINTSVTATAGTVTSTAIGSCVTLKAINATEWMAVSSIGTWTF